MNPRLSSSRRDYFSGNHGISFQSLSVMASPLVDSFTPPEREALSKFKAEYLQKALSEAVDDPSKSSDLEIWGVPIAEEGPRSDVIICKFLRAK
jgi:hypothetical protein